MELKYVRPIGRMLILISFIVLIVAINISGIVQIILVISGMIIFICRCIIYFQFWKCPSCDSRLPYEGSLGMTHCPYCGRELIKK